MCDCLSCKLFPFWGVGIIGALLLYETQKRGSRYSSPYGFLIRYCLCCGLAPIQPVLSLPAVCQIAHVRLSRGCKICSVKGFSLAPRAPLGGCGLTTGTRCQPRSMGAPLPVKQGGLVLVKRKTLAAFCNPPGGTRWMFPRWRRWNAAC